ncbi:MAG: tRNA (guanosine(37)-N1)-methyltransferase TrmD [Gammaproteobacteria bacterium]|nr:tRNA (guanosine(37)-N1)-methyltransferase TrmD [Gammaproteobacteria bacterium]
MHVAVVTLFPQMFEAIERWGITARAIDNGLLSLACVNPREHAPGPHRHVDDRPYGGGPGMVMAVAPLRGAIRAARERLGGGTHTVYLSPQGRRLDQAMLGTLAARERLVLVCGRYEGVDERLVALEIDEEISVGDFVTAGGELPAMLVIEAVTRLLPGALGHEDSARLDSFAAGLLDCPHYTRPESVDGLAVPAVLLGGDHDAIRRWRLKQALGRTWQRRPDLLAALELDDEQRALLEEFIAGQDA